MDASCQFSLNLFISFRISSAGSDCKACTPTPPTPPHPTHIHTGQDRILLHLPTYNRSGKQTFPNPDNHFTYLTIFFPFFFGRSTSKFNLVFKVCECKLGSPKSAVLPSSLFALEDNGRQSSWINPNRMMQRPPPPKTLLLHGSMLNRHHGNQTCSRSVTSLLTCAHTNVRFGLSLISGGIFRACLRKLKMCDMNQNMCAVFVPNKKKKKKKEVFHLAPLLGLIRK